MTNFTIEQGENGIHELTLLSDRLAMEDVQGMTEEFGKLQASVVLLRSSADNFCVGRTAGAKATLTPDEVRTRSLEPIVALYRSIRNASFPVIAAVNGQANGMGFALAASCDMIIAAHDASFAMPEIGHGFPPLLAIAQLSDILPRHLAFHYGASRATIGASELAAALRLPVVVADAELISTARAYVADIATYAVSAGVLKEFLAERDRDAYDADCARAMGRLAIIQSELSKG